MNLPLESLIAPEKVTSYLLVWLPKGTSPRSSSKLAIRSRMPASFWMIFARKSFPRTPARFISPGRF